MWEIEVRHEGLHKYRHIRGSDKNVVEQKARAQELEWAELWARKQEAERKQREREELWQKQWDKKQQGERTREKYSQQALWRTGEAQAVLDSLRKTLVHTLDVKDGVDWDKLKDNRPFNKPAPKKKPAPMKPYINPPKTAIVSLAPNRDHYKPRLGLLGRILPSVKAARLEAATQAFDAAFRKWVSIKNEKEDENAMALRRYEEERDQALRRYEEEKNNLEAEYERAVRLCELERIEYVSGQMLAN